MSDTVAFIDVGTNSIHMLIVCFYNGSLGTPVYQEKESVRIGESLYRSGHIDDETLQKVRAVLSNFSNIAHQYGAGKIIAMATCAAREAPNRSDLVSLAKECGVNLHIISGREEARLTRLGAVGRECQKCTLCIDIGGGSTEIAIALGNEDLYLDSLSLGAIRMAFGTGIDQSKNVTAKQYEALKRIVAEQSYHTIAAVREIGFETTVGSSGTMEALAEACATKRGDNDGTYLEHNELQSLMKILCELTPKERCKILKISANRSDIIVGGGAIVEALMDLLKIERIEISKRGLREGMMLDYLHNNCPADLTVRASSVKALASRCNCVTRHEAAVERYCGMIYEELTRLGLMEPSNEMRELLQYAAQLHDIGTVISFEKHHILSYMIIRNSYLAGFDNEELEKIALIARFHHHSFPRASNKLFLEMNRKEIQSLLKYAIILKIADVLDRGRTDAIEGIDMEILNDNLNMTISAKSDLSLSLWKLKNMSNEIHNLFGYRLSVRTRQVD